MLKSTQDALSDPKWSHVKPGTWTGSNSGRHFLEGCNLPVVHLLREGGNSCISGFRTPGEAREFRNEAEISTVWHVADLREDRPRYTRDALETARRARIEEIFDALEFEGREVEAVSGWSHDGGDEFTRPVFLAQPGDSVKIDLTSSPP